MINGKRVGRPPMDRGRPVSFLIEDDLRDRLPSKDKSAWIRAAIREKIEREEMAKEASDASADSDA